MAAEGVGVGIAAVRGRGAAGSGGGELLEKGVEGGLLSLLAEGCGVEVDRDQQGVRAGVGGVQQAEGLLVGEGVNAGAVDASAIGGVELAGDRAGGGPESPGEGGGGEVGGVAVVGEGVEEGVGGGVVGLAGAPKVAARRRRG